ncbi:hypothetical protein P879_07061 [Paragonimus westermani]|uniref:Uncharacterized protein n=1 Tax=Paragonimus westermani TaxID=34504 RepID=A0A8T0DQ62_9TREM|nr:hypothetical protein P879_07061 [Paragonimus westermani]
MDETLFEQEVESNTFHDTPHTDVEDLTQILFNLTRQGLVEQLKQAILENKDQSLNAINQCEEASLSCLHDAARKHDLECLKTLITVGGADVNLKTKDGLTPLHCAAKYKPIKLTEQVLYKKSIPMTKLVDCLVNPSEGGKEPVVDPVIEYLYECGSHLEEKDTNGMTALHYAAARNNVLAAKQLVQTGAYLECLDNEQMTPLLLAVRENHEEMVKLLLEFGANSQFTDRRNCNILHHACHDGDLNIFQTVVEHITNKHGKNNTVHMLNSFNKKRETPLHWAILSKSVDVTEMCIDEGADLNLRTAKGESALHLAARSGELEIAEILLNRGSDVNATDLDQRTPLFNAAENEHFKVASLLIKSGANINHADKENVTPLLLAAGLGKCTICELLIGNDVSVNVEDKQWKTPLMLAVEGKHLPVVQRLLGTADGPALLEWEDMSHNRPLHSAVRMGSLAITSVSEFHCVNLFECACVQKHLSLKRRSQY